MINFDKKNTMKAILTRFTINNFIEITGDDFVHLDIFFKTATKPEIRIPFVINYIDLYRFIKSADEKLYQYLTKIRSDITGYGPKHSQIFKILEAENFDFNFYIQLYLDSINEEIFAQHYEWCETIEDDKNEAKVSQIATNLSAITNKIDKSYAINLNNFRDEVDVKLHETMLAHFPTFFESDLTLLKEYKEILINTTLSFTESIDKLMFKGRKQ